MVNRLLWLNGATGSGKTAWLIEQLVTWAESEADSADLAPGKSWLVFAANGDNRIRLANRIADTTRGRFPVVTTTPNGFMQGEVELFWPLLVKSLGLFPPISAAAAPPKMSRSRPPDSGNPGCSRASY